MHFKRMSDKQRLGVFLSEGGGRTMWSLTLGKVSVYFQCLRDGIQVVGEGLTCESMTRGSA